MCLFKKNSHLITFCVPCCICLVSYLLCLLSTYRGSFCIVGRWLSYQKGHFLSVNKSWLMARNKQECTTEATADVSYVHIARWCFMNIGWLVGCGTMKCLGCLGVGVETPQRVNMGTLLGGWLVWWRVMVSTCRTQYSLPHVLLQREHRPGISEDSGNRIC